MQRSSFSNEINRLEEGHSVFRNSIIAKLSPFLDDVGLLRVGGRLQQTLLSYEEKHPLIIPKGHFGLLLVRFEHILMKHAGVGSMCISLRNSTGLLDCVDLLNKLYQDVFIASDIMLQDVSKLWLLCQLIELWALPHLMSQVLIKQVHCFAETFQNVTSMCCCSLVQ